MTEQHRAGGLPFGGAPRPGEGRRAVAEQHPGPGRQQADEQRKRDGEIEDERGDQGRFRIGESEPGQ